MSKFKLPKILRHISALVCLLALLCGGQLNVCACEIAAPPASCDGHDHSSHDGHGDESAPGDDAGCSCATCHSCQHSMVVLPTVLPSLNAVSGSASLPYTKTVAPTVAANIFIPPKLT